jgi:hypothetical protein
MTEVNLPDISKESSVTVSGITEALGVPREILANDEEIGRAWINLPSLLSRIDPEIRDEKLVRMCAAVSFFCTQYGN